MVDQAYWKRRSSLMYYKYIDAVVRGVASDARSLLDVGAANARYLENYEWIPRKVALDKSSTIYSSKNVEAVVTDFLEYVPEEKFDLVTCFQVLEHIPDATTFARKLFDVGRNVLISVPYKWRAGDCKWHVHDPVDAEKLARWTGRKPDYSIVVTEPFLGSSSRRLIAYYNDPNKKFTRRDARAKMQESEDRFGSQGAN